jgi:phenylalanyl-tRNA synthetase beta chain
VRKAARRHQIRTIASHRYERIVDARTLGAAMDRAAALIAVLTGGKILPGTLRAGKPLANPTTVRFRPERCLALLGFDVPRDRMIRHLSSVGVEVGPLGRGGDDLLCAVPVWRPDLSREIDLIEEVARIEGLDAVPVHDKMPVRVRPPQPSEKARRELGSVLTGLGFHETITFSFTTPKHALAFTPRELEPIVMDDARRGDEPALRPSVLTGLLTCRTRNQHAGVLNPPAPSALAPIASVGAGGVRLFELASAFAQRPTAGNRPEGVAPTAEETIEHFNVGLLMDCPGRAIDDQRAGVRAMRGVVEVLVKSLAGDVSRLVVEPSPPHAPAFASNGFARLSLRTSASERALGYFALLDKYALASFDLAAPVVVAELNLAVLLAHYPPRSRVVLPPTLPAIERDLSLVVRDDLPYQAIASALEQRKPANLERISYVTTYRGKPFAADRKSVTVRLAFREPGRTLTKDELEAPVAALLASLKGAFEFEIRA